MRKHPLRNFYLLISTLFLVALTIPTTLYGQSRYGRGRGVSAPSTAQITAAQRQLAIAAGQFKQAQTRFRAQSRQLMVTRVDVQKEHSQDGMFVAGQKKWDESKKELASVKTHIFDKLKSYNPEYKTALKDRDSFKRQLQADDFEKESERETMLKKYAATISLIAHLEKEAIYADENGATLQKKVDEHDSSFHELVKKREGDINQDSRLVAAKQSIIAAKADLDKADTQLAIAQNQLASAQLNYQRQLAAYASRNRYYRRY